MRYQLCMLDVDLTPDQANEFYSQACDVEDPSDLNQKVRTFIEEITSYYPQIDDYPEEEVDNCPWDMAFGVTKTSVVICIAWSRVEEVAPVNYELGSKA